MSRTSRISHDPRSKIGSWFLGPNAENSKTLLDHVKFIVGEVQGARRKYCKEDGDFITKEMTETKVFQASEELLKQELAFISKLLSEHSVPFWSPRYIGHMLSDFSMPGALGYLITMLYNPNNVAAEASPLTSYIEYTVGQQLCKMLGYNARQDRNCRNLYDEPVGWGHITCDGSVANLESIWVARNLKFYPLSLRDAMAKGKPLSFATEDFHITLCDGKTTKLFADCSAWELLNLTPQSVLDLPMRLVKKYGVSQEWLQKVMEDFVIQTTGKDELERRYNIQPPKYFISATKHYSWPKGTAISGIGRQNLIDVPIDEDARMDCSALEKRLTECIEKEQPVYAVVAIMGSTEHGAIDPLTQILGLRSKFQKLGLSFLVHADAAWGGYFSSLFTVAPLDNDGTCDPLSQHDPTVALQPYTERELRHLKYADSITIDPHKSGYIPYPAGGLCYRDERMRQLVTWTSPYIDTQNDGVAAMGVYGIEGSKPGASAVAVWLSHKVIGLHRQGYGLLLGEALLASVKMYGHWATMSLDHPNLIVVPFNMLPAERALSHSRRKGFSSDVVQKQRHDIVSFILKQPADKLLANDMAMELIKTMGSDLLVNAFACNFVIDGKVNSDVVEGNYLNSRIYEKLSVHRIDQKIADRPVIIMSTVFSQSHYGECLTNYKNRLGLEGDEDLFVLVAVSMSPFPRTHEFVHTIGDAFKQTAEREVAICLERNAAKPAYHTFVMQGIKQLHLVYMPMFNVGSHRQQLILTGDLPEHVKRRYQAACEQDPSTPFTLHTKKKESISNIAKTGSSFEAVIRIGAPKALGSKEDFTGSFQLENVRVIKHRSIRSNNLDPSYPDRMPFYLYGTPEECHVEHMILCSPNAQLNSSQVILDLDLQKSEEGHLKLAEGLQKGLIAVMDSKFERAMQPFTKQHRPDFFRPDSNFPVTVYLDPHDDPLANGPGLTHGREDRLDSPIGRGTLTLGKNVFVDFEAINKDPWAPDVESGITKVDVDRLDSPTRNIVRIVDHIDNPSVSRHVVGGQNSAHEYRRRMAVRRSWKSAVERPTGHNAP